MRLDQEVKRPQRGGAGPDLVGERREAEVDALPRVAVALPVERLVGPELLEHDHGEQARPEQSARGGVERCRWLGHGLAGSAGEPLAHGLDHLPPARDHLQRLGHILPQLRQPVRSAARAAHRREDYHPLARQMIGKRLARGARPRERHHVGADRGALAQGLVLAGARFQLLEPELQLVDQQMAPLGALAIQCAAHLLVLELEQRDPCRQIGVHRPGPSRFGLRVQECRAERHDIAGGHHRHAHQSSRKPRRT